MTKQIHLAFDLGAESGRAIVGFIESGQLKLNEIHRFPTKGLRVNGSFRWDIYRLFDEIKTGIAKTVKAYGANIASIGVDTWGIDFGLLDKKGKLINIPYHYRDDRTIGTEEKMEQRLGDQRIYEITGIQFMQINSLNQFVSMVEAEDPTLKIADKLLFIGDILNYFLSGAICSEFTAASTSQMVDGHNYNWSNEIFDAFNIPRWIQTPIKSAGEMVGNIRKELADELKLSPETKIILPAIHDTASAAVATPASDSDWAYMSSGTWSLMGVETEKPIINQKSYRMNITNSGGALGKNLFLKNIVGLWVIQQCKRIWEKEGSVFDYSELMTLAEKAQPFTGVIDTDHEMFLNPKHAPDAINAYLQMTNQSHDRITDIGTLTRIVIESLAFKYRLVLTKIIECTGMTVNRLHIVGGGSKNALLNQFTANSLGVPVYAGPSEATAAGNILMQAYGTGEIGSLQEIRNVVKDSFNIAAYKPQGTKIWEEKYAAYLKITGLKEMI